MAIKNKRGKKITVEVDNLNQLKKIMGLKFNTVLFDNMSIRNLYKGVMITKKYYETEASGNVSLQNNGGFASIRAYYGPSLEGINTISIRVKGDGQKYNFRVRTAEASWASYTVSFQTIPNKWLEFDFSLVDFSPTYRGYRLNQMPSLSDLTIRSIGFMISDKQEGEFNLSLDWVKAN